MTSDDLSLTCCTVLIGAARWAWNVLLLSEMGSPCRIGGISQSKTSALEEKITFDSTSDEINDSSSSNASSKKKKKGALSIVPFFTNFVIIIWGANHPYSKLELNCEGRGYNVFEKQTCKGAFSCQPHQPIMTTKHSQD